MAPSLAALDKLREGTAVITKTYGVFCEAYTTGERYMVLLGLVGDNSPKYYYFAYGPNAAAFLQGLSAAWELGPPPSGGYHEGRG